MTMRQKGLVVLAVQLAVVLSIAGKYAWERHTCPMVWTRAEQYDPSHPLRGRYLALTLHADACALSKSGDRVTEDFNGPHQWMEDRRQQRGSESIHSWSWQVTPAARDGKLTGQLAAKLTPGDTLTLTQHAHLPCGYAAFNDQTEFFIADHAQTPFPLKKGQELWALVTVPPSGPPRPVELAVSDGKDFRRLDLR